MVNNVLRVAGSPFLKRQEPEKLLQESIVQALSLEQRVPFNHIFAPRNMRDGVRAKRMGFQPGWPDLIFPAPLSLGLELKSPGGRQSSIQKNLQQEWLDYGLIYAVASSFDEAMDTIKQHCKWGYE